VGSSGGDRRVWAALDGQQKAMIDFIAQKVRNGGRVTADEAAELYREAPTHVLGRLADGIRTRKHPEPIVTYIIDRNVNYTNVCVARCNFCAFYRPVGSQEGYVLGFDEVLHKIEETIELGGNQLLLQGGHNPDLPIEWYEDLFRTVKRQYPDFKLHALSPPEVLHISRLARLSTSAVIERLVAAGLDSIPGGGAEILVDRVRKLLNCYTKASADEWIDVMRQAHHAGLRTTATMMYGTVEVPEERIEHLMRLRDLQDETGGFTAFITWSYQPEHTEHGGAEATGVEYLRTLALARIVLDNVDNLQASWVTQGGKVGQLSLAYGANDMGSVMIEENVVRAAGASYCMDEVEIVENIEDAGFAAKRRNMHYEILGEPIYRERQVPRMLALATARQAGDASVPAELRNYPARSRTGRQLRLAQ
jgi:cyclic dehypoxanthinyl futalosine synthase